MSTHPWSNHPSTYRENEVQQLNRILNAGECVSLIGLSGMGKSNLLGFLEYQSTMVDDEGPACVLIDCNRLHETSQKSFFQLAASSLISSLEPTESELRSGEMEEFNELEVIVSSITSRSPRTGRTQVSVDIPLGHPPLSE
jgi:energy-coupling factor transporter ATP-binding protein EcfA2